MNKTHKPKLDQYNHPIVHEKLSKKEAKLMTKVVKDFAEKKQNEKEESHG